MPSLVFRLVFSTLLVAHVASGAPAQGAPPPALPSLTLQDQFNVATALSTTSPTIFLASAREGSEAMKRWLLVLRAAAPGNAVRIVQVADLKGAPFFVKGRIRSSMPKDTSVRILLDWDGKFARPLRGDRGELVAAVYGADGRLKTWEALSLTAEDASVAQTLVRSALAR